MSVFARSSMVIAVALTIGFAAPVAAQNTIGQPARGYTGGFGPDAWQSFGQTVTVPSTANRLLNFSFWLGKATAWSETASFGFKAYVFQWSVATARTIGSAVFVSPEYSYEATTSSPYTQVKIDTGNIGVTTGDVYALFVTAASGTGAIMLEWGGGWGTGYAGGEQIIDRSQSELSGFDNAAWTTFGGGEDLHFEAQFTHAPEPSTWILLGSGLLGLGLAARRSKRRNEEERAA